MINESLYNIAKVLKNKYGYKIYTDSVEQGFETPAFFIKCIDFDRDKLLTNERITKHYRNNLSVAITYFSKNTHLFREDFNTKIVELLDLLENVKGEYFTLKLENSNSNVIDNTLIMTMNFKVNIFRTIKKSDRIIMDKLYKEVY